MIGGTISTDQGINLTIAGISETGEPDIYVDPDLILMLCRVSFTFVTEDTVQSKYPDYQSADLGITQDGKVEVLVSRARLQQAYADYLSSNYGELILIYRMIKQGEGDQEELQTELEKLEERLGLTVEEYIDLMNSHTAYLDYTYEGLLTGNVQYSVVGYYDVDENVDFIIPDEAIPYFEKAVMDYYQSCYVYIDAEDVETMEKKIKDVIPEETKEYLQVKVVNEAQAEVQAYKNENREKYDSRILVTMTIFVIAMVILYFIMKANAVARMQDLGVYRMLGISKGSIVGMFVCENFIITSYTSLAGVLLTTFISVGMSRIESLEMNVTYPWYAVVLTIIFFYSVNILVGIMPIRKMLKIPPAQLAAKYDI